MAHIILIKALYQTILSAFIASKMNTAKYMKISCFRETLMSL